VVPQSLRNRAQWLVWRFEPDVRPDKKPRKVPYCANGGWRAEDRRQGEQGSPDDRLRLVTYDEAIGHALAPDKGGVGFAFLPGDGLIGIDLDAVIDAETGEISERARNIIAACNSYTEYSPSGRGVHIIVAGDTAALFDDGRAHSFKSNAIGVEVFCGAQYFTFTGKRYSGTPEEVQPVDERTLRRLYNTVRPDSAASVADLRPGVRAPESDDARRADAALAYVDAEDYQTWIDIGHALKHAFGEAGFSLWDRWSQKSAKYPGATQAAKKWASFNPNGSLTLGTVFELAKRGGYQPPRTPKRSKSADSGGRPPSDGDRGAGAGPRGDSRPVIRWVLGELPKVVDQAEDSLLRSGVRIYQRGGFLVRVVKRPVPSVRNYKRPSGVLGLVTVDQYHLTETFTRAARWQKYSGKKDDWVDCNAPYQVASTYIARVGQWQVPQLWSAISAPTLRPDGTVLQDPGYDRDTQSWYDPGGIEFPKIAEHPGIEDARAALEKLKAAIGSFPFDSDVDRSVALALALTALVRRSLPSAPLGAITAPIMASGKTLLADAIAILATGASAPAMKYADKDEEFTKTMLAVLAEGDQVVLIDNVERPLEGDTLCAVLTSEAYRQRILGKTEMMSVPTTTLFLATGNALVIAGDLRTRALLCRLDPKCEHPEQRQFDVELRQWMLKNRAELVAAGLTIMRSFIASGQRPQDFCNTWGRFEHWSDMVRAPLIWLDCMDPCASLKELEREDPERIALGAVMAAWEAVLKDEPRSVAEAIKAASGPEAAEQAFRETLLLVCKDRRSGDLDPYRLGSWLRKHADRLMDRKRFVRAGVLNHATLWKVETMP
jgi:putative DNA primase/helicase